ncbi:DUF3027 domain-containing protein [Oerskovia merdavium]|uniref:DUF3027 domain-containing protein n=1 Tax=Oerskovia merdavium TaxID=2762227 RepID=A0ABR8TXU3_9CELL|nr:DUF3027 domain-containing protein [Oerskovia merdavium]
MAAVAAAEGPTVRRVSARAAKDAVLTGAVDLARAAAEQVAEHPGDVGEHLGTLAVEDRLISHLFACTMLGYRGWRWTVTLARVPRGRVATVCEVELLPGDGAILAPEWLPWSERLRPGDIGAGDVLPFQADDPRLEPGYVPTGDEEQDEVAIEELALARVRVLSPQGRDEAAERWYRGTRGPTAPGAVASSAECGSCGFLVPLQGALGQLFAVCANPWSPDDGKVVSLDHGCGAHSETDVEPHPTDWPAPDPLIDEMDVEIVQLLDAAQASSETAEPAADGGAVRLDVPVDVEVPAEAAAVERSAEVEASIQLALSRITLPEPGTSSAGSSGDGPGDEPSDLGEGAAPDEPTR